jgi:phenylpropionate dioxygenase-like ring-hydroxylating dioxygenase large terminal subunit
MLFKNFWYVLAESSSVGTSPLRVHALVQDFVLFRRASDNKVVALSDICIHRMSSLALGKVVGDTIQCPYHGWTYGGDGACTFIPANKPGTPVPRRARVDSYPVEERYGWVWVFLGDLPEEERPPIPDFPEFGQAGFRAVRGEFTWQADYTRVLENTVDVAHTPFVHASSFGNTEDPVMPDYKVITKEHSVEATVVLKAPKPKGLSKLVMGEGSTNEVSLAIYMPCLNRLDSSFSNGWRIVLLLSHLPVDERTTLTRFIQLRTFFPYPFADGFARRFTGQILKEDQPMVESQNPHVVPPEPGADLSTKSDILSIAYRKLLNKYVDLGWRMDALEVRRAYQEEERVLLIPSPERRSPDSKGTWVLDEVPVVGRSSEVSFPSIPEQAADSSKGVAASPLLVK